VREIETDRQRDLIVLREKEGGADRKKLLSNVILTLLTIKREVIHYIRHLKSHNRKCYGKAKLNYKFNCGRV